MYQIDTLKSATNGGQDENHRRYFMRKN